MSEYSRMIGLLARETPEGFRKTVLGRKAETIAHLKAGENDPDNPNLNPESEEALDATVAESRSMGAALQTWKHLTGKERKEVEELLEKAGWPDPDDCLYYDLTTRLPG